MLIVSVTVLKILSDLPLSKFAYFFIRRLLPLPRFIKKNHSLLCLYFNFLLVYCFGFYSFDNICRKFEDIFDVDHFIDYLKDDVRIVRDIPEWFTDRTELFSSIRLNTLFLSDENTTFY